MKREALLIEVQRRLNLIKVSNGFSFDVLYVFRNPETETSPDTMPCVNIFELEDISIDFANRAATVPPIIKKSFKAALEMWVQSTSEGKVSSDVVAFLKHVRTVLFTDGVTMGGKAALVSEVEVSHVIRPQNSSYIGGIGCVLEFIYFEDFSNL